MANEYTEAIGGGSNFMIRAKITVDAWQIIKQFPSVFAHVTFPTDFLTFLFWIGAFVGLDIPQLVPAACYRYVPSPPPLPLR